jgi:ABC-type polysaccharide/polyol phosphate transport system ATPase subunit
MPEQPPKRAITVQNLGVRYNLRLSRTRTVRSTFSRLMTRDRAVRREFWALQGVSFDVLRGEALAVLGANGAGKSTLLQVLARIITPSAGGFGYRGRVSTLLSLGAGFDSELSGRANIALGGSLLGLSGREIARESEAIIAFADIGEFIDAPIKTYSSGMRARLGFALATTIEPDILLLDEVLSTGDGAFREKSKERVEALIQGAGAVVVVSHDVGWIKQFCARAILLDRGRLIATGPAAEIAALHRERMHAANRSGTTVVDQLNGPATRPNAGHAPIEAPSLTSAAPRQVPEGVPSR